MRAVLLTLCAPLAVALFRGHLDSAPAGPKVDSLQVEVSSLRVKLETVSKGLSKLLSPDQPLVKSPIAKEVSTFASELTKVLKETKDARDTHHALKQLHDAQEGVHVLFKDITAEQMRLMHESDDQEVSLLLGVLMTRQTEPMAKQLEVMTSSEFKHLPVVTAVLKDNDQKTPLFKQLAAKLDKAGPKVAAPPVHAKPSKANILAVLNKQLQHMESTEKHAEEMHMKVMKLLNEEEAKQTARNSTQGARHTMRLMKGEQHQYSKDSALAHRNLLTLRDAISAVQRGDAAAVKRAINTMTGLMNAMEAHRNGFLVLVELGHQVEGSDCPYCVAQCVEKCHTVGNSYQSCLGQCADAGKEQ